MTVRFQILDPNGNLIVGVERHEQLVRLLRFFERRETPTVVETDQEGEPVQLDYRRVA